MLLDALLAFVSPGNPLSLVAGAGISIPSPLTYDFLGLGVGVAPTNNIIGSATPFGQADAMGIPGNAPQLVVNVGTPFTTSNGARLNVQFQGAPDTGAAGGYLPGTWQTYEETGPITVAQLVALTTIARFTWVPPFPVNQRPRFMRVNFVPVPTDAAPSTPVNFTAGTIAHAVVSLGRDDPFQKYATNNYSVA